MELLENTNIKEILKYENLLYSTIQNIKKSFITSTVVLVVLERLV